MMICSYFSAYSTLLNIITLHGTILTILHRGENMALIKCPECGNVVSDKALSCPKCGFPVANFQNKSTVPNTAPPLPNKATSTYDSTDNIYLDCGKGHYIKIENGILSISVPLKPLTQDMLENFTLEYYGVSLGLNVGFYIVNINKHYYSGVVDVIVKKRTLVEFNRFMSIMEKHGLFAKRSRVSVLYKNTDTENSINEQIMPSALRKTADDNETPFDGIYRFRPLGNNKEIYCPLCKSSDCSWYSEKKVTPAKIKTEYRACINPFRPLTIFRKKKK